MHPTPEEIKGMLIQHTPTPVQYVVDAYRALLKENKRWKDEALLQARLYTQKNDKYYELQDQLQQTREELEHEKKVTELFDKRGERIEFLLTELGQVKAEWDEDKKFTEAAAVGVVKLQNEVESLRTELSAKDNVLEWYADKENYTNGIAFEVDPGDNARYILDRYKGEIPND